MNKNPQAYLKEPYSRILIPNEDGTFSAEILEFPGCFAEGETPDEAMQNLEAAAESWIEAALDQGLEIPEPAMNQGYSGKIALRLPRSLHRQAVRMAQRDGTSLNQFLVSAIAARLGAEDFYASLTERLYQRFATSARSTVIYSLTVADFKQIRSTSIASLQGPIEPMIEASNAPTQGSGR